MLHCHRSSQCYRQHLMQYNPAAVASWSLFPPSLRVRCHDVIVIKSLLFMIYFRDAVLTFQQGFTLGISLVEILLEWLTLHHPHCRLGLTNLASMDLQVSILPPTVE